MQELQELQVRSLGQEDPLEDGMATPPRPVACFKEGDEKKIPDVVLIWDWGLKTDLFRGK